MVEVGDSRVCIKGLFFSALREESRKIGKGKAKERTIYHYEEYLAII